MLRRSSRRRRKAREALPELKTAAGVLWLLLDRRRLVARKGFTAGAMPLLHREGEVSKLAAIAVELPCHNPVLPEEQRRYAIVAPSTPVVLTARRKGTQENGERYSVGLRRCRRTEEDDGQARATAALRHLAPPRSTLPPPSLAVAGVWRGDFVGHRPCREESSTARKVVTLLLAPPVRCCRRTEARGCCSACAIRRWEQKVRRRCLIARRENAIDVALPSITFIDTYRCEAAAGTPMSSPDAGR
nr:hypothetical protein Iba_chr03aCG7760 [Ipomoea batatas]